MKRLSVFLTVLSLLLLIVLPACGGGGGGGEKTLTPTTTATPITTSTAILTPIPTPTATAAATATPAATPSATTSGSPVKIGAICAWSGPMSISGLAIADPVIKLVQQQVKDQGGILGGREVDVVRYDDAGSTAQGAAGVEKLYSGDKVAAIVFGGESGAEFNAVADMAEKDQILFVTLGNVDNMENMKFTVNATVQASQDRGVPAEYINKVLKPKTVAYLADDDAEAHLNVSGMKALIEPAVAKTVYEEYFSMSTSDYSPYLTKIKYVNPDVLYIYTGVNEAYLSIAKQIMDLGGWGNIKVVNTAAAETAKNLAGAQGWYMFALWVPGLNYPGAVKFENDYKAINKVAPTNNHVYYYNSLWTAIYAIKLAGTDTDRVAIAQAARSGNLEWDTPMGHAHFAPDGTSGLNLIMVQVQDKKMVQLITPQ